MNNLVENYEIILSNLKMICGAIDSFPQIKKPKLINLELVNLNLTAEYISINTELQLFRCLKGEGNYSITQNPLEKKSLYVCRNNIICLFNAITRKK